MNPPVEISDSPAPKVLSPDTIARERERAAAGHVPDEPMAGATNDVIGHPSDSFNVMASALEKGIKEAMSKKDVVKDRATGPDESDKKVTDSKTKPPTDAKAEPAPEPELPENITSAKSADWKLLKEKRAEAEKQAKEFREKYELTNREYEEFRKKAADPTQQELTKKQIKELTEAKAKLESDLKEVDIERSEEFQSYYKQKFDDAMNLAKGSVDKEIADQVEALIQMPESAWRKQRLNEIREELVGMDQTRLDNAVIDYDKARAERTAQLKNTKQSYEKLQQMRMEKTQQERKSAEMRAEAALSAVLSVARENFDSFKRGDDKDHNAFVDQAEEFTDRFFKNKLSDVEKATLPIMAVEAKRLSDRVVPELQKKVKELEEALKQYKTGSPRPGSGDAGRTAAPSGKGFIEVFNEQWPAGNR